MSQFDETTEHIAHESFSECLCGGCVSWRSGIRKGRNSTKSSMEILARAVDEVETAVVFKRMELPELLQAIHHKLREAKRKIKANGDWPLEDK